MKAPDKIYLYREQPKDYFDENWHELPASDVENIEYICKDVLLKWANDVKAELEKDNGIKEDVRKGAIWELKEIIAKIESL